MESTDWRAQLQRQRIMYKIMDTLKTYLPFSGYKRLQELKKIAERVEHEIFAVATTQSEYTRKICFMMLTIETRLQNTVRSSAAALYNSVNPSVPLESSANNGDWQDEVYQQIKAMKDLYDWYLLDSTAHTDNLNGEDVLEEVYQKIKAMKDLYLLDLTDMHQKIVSKLKQLDSLPQQPENERLEKLKKCKNMLERFIQFLKMPKHGTLAIFKDRLGTYEKHIINITNSYRRKPASTQQQGQALPSSNMQSLQQSIDTSSVT